MTRQPRERPVPCSLCRAPTWNTSARCDKHSATHPSEQKGQ